MITTISIPTDKEPKVNLAWENKTLSITYLVYNVDKIPNKTRRTEAKHA